MRKLLVLTLLAATSSAFAQAWPSHGLLYSADDQSVLVYDCTLPLRGEVLECDLNRMSVRHKVTSADLDSILKNGRERFRAGNHVTPEECANPQLSLDLVQRIRSGQQATPAELEKRLATLTELEKGDFNTLRQLVTAACKSKTEEDYVAIARFAHEIGAGTCYVGSRRYRRQFESGDAKVGAPGSLPASWVVKAPAKPAAGPCGLKDASRFERRTEALDGHFWKYTVQTVVTKPDETANGQSCKSSEEKKVYELGERARGLGCRYIVFDD